MDYIHKLPFILSALVTIAVGGISFFSGTDNKELYIRMAVAMISFYLLGMLIRNIFEGIINELSKKKEQEEKARLEEEAQLEEQLKQQQKQQQKSTDELQENENNSGSFIDYKVDDSGDEFSPFKVSEIINTKEK